MESVTDDFVLRAASLTLALSWAALVSPLSAQCPDGSPPPCRVPGSRGGTAVAVLYFDNLSPDTADAYLADGVTEELIVRIGQVRRLQVSSRYAVRRFRGRPIVAPATIGQELSVAYLITGSVRRSHDHVRVTAELVRAATGARVWGEVYDRQESDLLVLQTDLARDVAAGIIGRLAPTEQTTLAGLPTQNPAAFEHFLRGNYLLAQRSPAGTVNALTEYQAALRLDPAYAAARARAALACGVFVAWDWRYPSVSRDTLLTWGMAAAEAVLRRDSTSSDAWLAYGLLLFVQRPGVPGDAVAAEQRAVSLDSENAEAVNLLGVMLFNVGQDSAAAVEFRRALAIEPGRAITLMRLAEIDLLAERFGGARRLLDSAIAVAPGFHIAYQDRAWVLLHVGDTAAARVDAETALRLAPEDYEASRGVLAAVQFAERDTLRARASLDSLLAPYGKGSVVGPEQVSNIAMPLARVRRAP